MANFSWMDLDEVRKAAGNPAVSTIYLWEAKGVMPRKVKIGQAMVRWRSDEIEAWLSDPEGWRAAHADRETP